MITPLVLDMKNHYPVLLSELISIITPQYGGTFIDCTFGQGGYTKKILEFKDTKVIGLDRDVDSAKKAEEIQKDHKDRFLFKNIKFSQIDNLKLKNENIKGALFDLGYSYNQIKDEKKGLSFNSVGDLNMQMGLNRFSAKEVINTLDQEKLEKIFKFFGEEKASKRIAYRIVKEREKKEIDTQHLVKIIESSIRKKSYKTHCATKVFQALRIFVNKEITELIEGIIKASKLLNPGGKIIIISFHSIEDKIIKFYFSNYSKNKSKPSRYLPEAEEQNSLTLFEDFKHKFIKPSENEVLINPPSRSAKLRYIVRNKNKFKEPEDFKNKFKKYTDLERLNDK